MIEQAKARIAAPDCSVAAVLADGRILTGFGKTVRPLFALYTDHRAELRGAFVADRIIGKAAAALLCDAGASEVFGFLMSQTGYDLLVAHGIRASYNELVPFIENYDGSALCPSERAVDGSNDPAVCAALLADFLAETPEPSWLD